MDQTVAPRTPLTESLRTGSVFPSEANPTLGLKDALIKHGLENASDLEEKAKHLTNLGMSPNKASQLVANEAFFNRKFGFAVESITNNFFNGTNDMAKVINTAWESLSLARNSVITDESEKTLLIQKRTEDLSKAVDAYIQALKARMDSKEKFESFKALAVTGMSVLLACLPLCTGNQKALSGVNVAAYGLDQTLDFVGIAFNEVAKVNKDVEDILMIIYKDKQQSVELRVSIREALESLYYYYKVKAHSEGTSPEETSIALEKVRTFSKVLGIESKDILADAANVYKVLGNKAEKQISAELKSLSKLEMPAI